MSKDARRTCTARPVTPRARMWRLNVMAAVLVAAACDVPTGLPRFENTLALPAPEIDVPVTGVPAAPPPVTVDLSEVDADMVDRARRGEIEFTPVNPENGTGTLQITLADAESGATVTESITITPAGEPQVVAIDGVTIREFLGGEVRISIAGALGPATLPLRTVTLEPLVRIMFEIGGEG